MKYFKEHFFLKFDHHQVVTCIIFEGLNFNKNKTNSSENATFLLVALLRIHKRLVKKFYSKISSVQDICKKRDDVVATNFILCKIYHCHAY